MKGQHIFIATNIGKNQSCSPIGISISSHGQFSRARKR